MPSNKSKKTQYDDPYVISAKKYSQLPDEERRLWSPVRSKYEKLPLICKISFILSLVCVIIYISACTSQSFADFFNIYIGSVFRSIFAKISNLVPFSIAEFLIITLPFIIFLSIWYLLKFRCPTPKASLMSALCVLSVAAMFFSSFVLTFATGYRGSSLEQKLELESEEVSTDELYASAEYLSDKINFLSQNINYNNDGFSTMPYSFCQMNDKLIDAYESFSEKHNFINNFYSRLKPVMVSEAMSYTHITGVYTFFTGESNINVAFPDYTVPYTAAHELAHQRGISREDEANMIAFLVCIESKDRYIQYSAYLNMYEYIMSALYNADRNLYKTALNDLDKNIRGELAAYSSFFDKYEDSTASKVTDTVNDTYLKVQGTEGKKSYGMVVDITVAYLKSMKYID